MDIGTTSVQFIVYKKGIYQNEKATKCLIESIVAINNCTIVATTFHSTHDMHAYLDLPSSERNGVVFRLVRLMGLGLRLLL